MPVYIADSSVFIIGMPLSTRMQNRVITTPEVISELVDLKSKIAFEEALGSGLEVEPPRRLTAGPTVHRHRDHVRTVVEIAEDHAALLAGATPGGRETHHPVAVGLRTPQADSATGNAVQESVYGPESANEPPGRKPRSFRAFV